MVPESLIPCVQYGCKANSASKVISAELQKGFRDSFKQDRVDRFPVTEGNRIQFMGRVKTLWKYGTGRSSALRSSSHFAFVRH